MRNRLLFTNGQARQEYEHEHNLAVGPVEEVEDKIGGLVPTARARASAQQLLGHAATECCCSSCYALCPGPSLAREYVLEKPLVNDVWALVVRGMPCLWEDLELSAQALS